MIRAIVLPSASRGDIDAGFIRVKRAMGMPDAAIARMGGWNVADVAAIPREAMVALERKPPAIPIRVPLTASAIPEVREILLHVAEQNGVEIADILGPSQMAEIVTARHEAIAVVWELNRYSLRDLAEIFRKTNEAITYGLKRHYKRLAEERDWS